MATVALCSEQRDSYNEQSFRHSCHSSWQTLRQSPIFGCICPNNINNKKACDKIFNEVNGNDCIGKFEADVYLDNIIALHNSQSNYISSSSTSFCLVIFSNIGHISNQEKFLHYEHLRYKSKKKKIFLDNMGIFNIKWTDKPLQKCLDKTKRWQSNSNNEYNEYYWSLANCNFFLEMIPNNGEDFSFLFQCCCHHNWFPHFAMIKRESKVSWFMFHF